jgi:hypothetical protein
VDLGSIKTVTGVETAGNGRVNEGAATFQVAVSTDGTSFTDTGTSFSQDASEFSRWTSTLHTFTNGTTFDARYIRFSPSSMYGWAACLRVEVYTTDCTCQSDWIRCDSDGGDCCTSPDSSKEERRCTGGYTPIYTGKSCSYRATSSYNQFACYPPGCSSLPDDVCGPNNCYSSAGISIVLVIIIIVIVVGVVGGIFACYKCKYCCWQKRPAPPQQATTTNMNFTNPAAVPVTVPMATMTPVPVPMATAAPVPVVVK